MKLLNRFNKFIYIQILSYCAKTTQDTPQFIISSHLTTVSIYLAGRLPLINNIEGPKIGQKNDGAPAS